MNVMDQRDARAWFDDIVKVFSDSGWVRERGWIAVQLYPGRWILSKETNERAPSLDVIEKRFPLHVMSCSHDWMMVQYESGKWLSAKIDRRLDHPSVEKLTAMSRDINWTRQVIKAFDRHRPAGKFSGWTKRDIETHLDDLVQQSDALASELKPMQQEWLSRQKEASIKFVDYLSRVETYGELAK